MEKDNNKKEHIDIGEIGFDEFVVKMNEIGLKFAKKAAAPHPNRNRRKIRKNKGKLYPLADKNGNPVWSVFHVHFVALFEGRLPDIVCKVNGKPRRLYFDDFLIAYNGKYWKLDDFAASYKQFDDDFTVRDMLVDACMSAIPVTNIRVNIKTNKDVVLGALCTNKGS